jgi:NADH:ubiquinone oxidoreductase subunit E
MSDNLSFLAGRKGVEKSLFEEIVKESKSTGTPESAKLKELANEFLVGNAVTHGTASFYDFTRKEHEGKKVHVCNGSACLLAGTQEAVGNSLKKHFKEEEIGHMCCLGRCHENAAFNMDGGNYSGSDIDKLDDLISVKITSDENHHVEACVDNPVFLNAFPGLDEYYASFKDVLKKGAEAILDEIKKSGVRGRGGGGFPMGFKWDSCKNTPSDQKFVVCNADEGDPGAYSDRYLLEQQPHAVLQGMMVAGYIIGANRGVLYIRGEYPESIEVIRKAIDELETVGLNGENILG